MNEFQLQILEHYKSPHNFGKPSFKPTNIVTLENKSCGDKLTLYLEVINDEIPNLCFEGEGCSICIATASLLYSTCKGESVDFVKSYKLSDVLDLIGVSLTSARLKCANLPLEVIQSSV